MSITRSFLIAAVLLPTCAIAAEPNDLREFRVGMSTSELPESGYGAFACADDPARKLSDWREYSSCPAGKDGSHAVSFRYDNAGGRETEVGGQPVNLALLIGDNAKVTGLRIETDQQARLYLHKKAYLFGQQVRARFGEDGWSCDKIAPTAMEQPVGGVFVHEHCEKVTESRRFVLDRQLYRDPAKDLRDFTDATQLTILHAG